MCEGVRGEGVRSEGGVGGRRDMTEYTSREEIHVAAMEGVKSSQLKKLVSQSQASCDYHVTIM